MFITIEQAKQHLNLDRDFNVDNEYIIHLIQTAESAIAKRLNVKSLSKLVNPNSGGLPEDVIHAILLLIGDWYSSRETFTFNSVGKLPYTFDFLADLNKNYKTQF